MGEKVYTLFAGVNGAGKSTFYYILGENFGHRVNFDEITLLRDLIEGEQSFNQETTLTGNTIISNIKRAKGRGFKIHLYYVGLESVDLSIKRVAQRVQNQNLHAIPEEDLRRRFNNSFDNLGLVLPLCDVIKVYDNSGNYPDGFMKLVMSAENIEGRRNVGFYDGFGASQRLRQVLHDFIGGNYENY